MDGLRGGLGLEDFRPGREGGHLVDMLWKNAIYDVGNGRSWYRIDRSSNKTAKLVRSNLLSKCVANLEIFFIVPVNDRGSFAFLCRLLSETFDNTETCGGPQPARCSSIF